ncbi:HAD-IIIA family hydrolase [Desulfovibrio sulfodismutans]|uniref:D,D-heptose 1,7-bisphosphate phosphatase n=1 Tax=Desulfolutivibrio sulfodismutans TaxID=63561 RepID=A0A7K3NT68_9BACT|nr:HAD-IIIA family hydrolase [Desulfolutivibrio sulfodismutans]NDY58449.1 HAD-IIIA family hydrolase [Desulfolutivibrio sulfodismutans]
MSEIDTVLLDRDGTVIVDEHYLCDPARVRLLPGAGQALARLADAGMRLFVVSNQSGIGRGYFSQADHLAVQARLLELLNDHGVGLTGDAFCPHAPDAACSCRKPGLGQWEALRASHGLDAAHTAVIGDKASDVAFGKNLGAAVTVLVLTGHGVQEAQRLGLPTLAGEAMDLPPGGGSPKHPWPDVLARDLAAAVERIVGK